MTILQKTLDIAPLLSMVGLASRPLARNRYSNIAGRANKDIYDAFKMKKNFGPKLT